MKKTLALTLTIFAASLAGKASTIAEADSAYMNDDFATAISLYEQSIAELGPSAERYYNLGNSYYRAGQPGRAIVNYERALRLDPGNKDAAENLEFVNSKTTDRIETYQSVIGTTTDKLSDILGSNTWAWLTLALFLISLTGAGCYIFGNSIMLRKTGFFGAGITLLLCIATGILARRSMNRATASDEAIVIRPSVMLSTVPRHPKDRSEEAVLLHEGTKIRLVDSINTENSKWYKVNVDDNNRAWIQAEAVEVI